MDQGAAADASAISNWTFQKPITISVRSTVHGPDMSQNTGVARTNFTGRQGEAYMMDDLNSDQDGWKGGHLDPMV